jgi:pyruvate kinase
MLTLESVFDSSKKAPQRKSKIIATVGPASRDPEILKKLIKAGVNVFRLNFSHGSYEEHSEALARIRKASAETDTFVAVLQDLSGPKLRITEVDDTDLVIPDNASVILRGPSSSKSSAKCIYMESVNPSEALEPGQPVLLADGSLVFEVKEVTKTEVLCRALKGGKLRSRIGIAFPDSALTLPAATEKDLRDLKWGVQNQVDYVALSFVNSAEDVKNLKEEIARLKGDQRVIAKIERKAAIQDIDRILDYADGVMVARGDLGVNVALERLPILQKLLVEKCNARGLPVIVATQMLQSMVTSIRPTRAEVSDVSLAVLNGADAMMLSEETAIGQYPEEAIKYLDNIAREAERRFEFQDFNWPARRSAQQSVAEAVMFAACGAADKCKADAIVACTETGASSRLTAKYRPTQPLYGVSSREDTCRRMCLYWGVYPILCKPTETHSDEIVTALKEVQIRENLPNGSRAVVTGGIAARNPGSTSILEVREMNFR